MNHVIIPVAQSAADRFLSEKSVGKTGFCKSFQTQPIARSCEMLSVIFLISSVVAIFFMAFGIVPHPAIAYVFCGVLSGLSIINIGALEQVIKLGPLDKQTKLLKEEVNRLDFIKDSLQHTSEELTHTKEELQEVREKLTAEIMGLQQRIDELSAQIHQLEGSNKEYSRLNKDHESQVGKLTLAIQAISQDVDLAKAFVDKAGEIQKRFEEVVEKEERLHEKQQALVNHMEQLLTRRKQLMKRVIALAFKIKLFSQIIEYISIYHPEILEKATKKVRERFIEKITA